MKNYFLHDRTPYNDEIYFIKAHNKEDARHRLKIKFGLSVHESSILSDIEEIKCDCVLLAEIDNPNYDG